MEESAAAGSSRRPRAALAIDIVDIVYSQVSLLYLDSFTTSDMDGDQQLRLPHVDDYLRYGRQMILHDFGLEGRCLSKSLF